MKTENLSTLKINKLSQAQYDRELLAGNLDEYALYLTPEDDILSIEKGGTGNNVGYIRTGQKAGETIGNRATAEGNETTASGEVSHAEGVNTTASKYASHAEGGNTTASGEYSHAEGYYTISNGNRSHAEGSFTEAVAECSHAEGYNTYCSDTANDSHAEGCETRTHAKYSHTEGYYTVAYGEASHVQGKCNIVDDYNRYAHIVGNGSCTHIEFSEPLDLVRSNCHTLDWNGNATFAGSVTGAGADYAEYFEWLDGNPNAEDRIGLIVTLDGDKIRLANLEDDILGVVSATAMVVGDNAEWEWKDKYLYDNYGRVITEMVEQFEYVKNPETKETEKVSIGFAPRRKLNPNYDPEQVYIRRSERSEWSTIGLIGKLHVTDDGTCVVGGYATVGNNGVATKSESKTNMRIMKRISDTVILVFMK